MHAAIRGTISISNGVIYAGCDDGNLYALNSSTGVTLQAIPAGSSSASPGTTPQPVQAAAALAGGNLLISSNAGEFKDFRFIPTPTVTPTNTPNWTPTASFTNSPPASPTNTPTASPTATFTATPSATSSSTPTPTFTASPSYTTNFTATNTPILTATPTITPTFTPTFTNTPVTCYQSFLMWGSQGSGSNQFNNPAELSIDTNGLIYVGDTSNNRIDIYNSSGQFLETVGSGAGSGCYSIGYGCLNSPFSAGADANGNIFIADTGHNLIQKFDSNGNFVLQWGGSGTQNGQLSSDYGLCVDSANSFVYVADRGNQRVQNLTFMAALSPPGVLWEAGQGNLTKFMAWLAIARAMCT